MHYRTENERLVADELRAISVEYIREMDPEEVQAALGLARSGLIRLLYKQDWDFKLAFRVADCLHLPVVDELRTEVENYIAAATEQR